MQYRRVYTCDNRGTNASTSCNCSVKIVPVTSAGHRLENGNCTATQPQYDDRRSFGTLAFKNELEYRNFDFSMLVGHYLFTSSKVLVRLVLVIPIFKTYEVVALYGHYR